MIRKILIGCCLLLLLFSRCTKVMNLSDEATLTAFDIKSTTPSDIELGIPTIKGDTVLIPVLRGVSLFPMSVSAQPKYTSNTERAVTGTSFSSFNDIKFDLEDIELNKFYLVAKSGQTKPYYIKLLIEDQDEKNDFKELNITGSPSNALIAKKGFVNPIKRTINIFAINAGFPLEITANAVVSENAHIKNNANVLEKEALKMSFNKYGDFAEYTVEAENGAFQQWKVFLHKAEEATGTESSDILASLSLNAAKQSAEIKTAGYKIGGTSIDNNNGRFIFLITPLTRSINLEIVPTLTTLPNSQVIGYNAGESVIFENYNSSKKFYILDGRSGYYKEWKFDIMEGGIEEILSFPFTHKDKSPSGKYTEINPIAVIDNINKKITLNVEKFVGLASYWPLTVVPNNVTCTTGATVEIDTLYFKNIRDSAHFKVTSPLGEKKWTVKLLSAIKSVKNNIDSVNIISSSYPVNPIIYNNSVYIDLKDRAALPLRIQPHLYISADAHIENFQNGEFLEFNSFTDTIKINVIAQSGATKTWRFQLLETTQLYNSNFDLWNNVSAIDPIPGTGRGWSSANNLYVKGTTRVANGSHKYAAQLETSIVSIPKDLITSGTLFLGSFRIKIAEMGNPRKMTTFGVPFEARPTAIAIDAKYEPGDKLQKSVLESGTGLSSSYRLENIVGEDKGQIWVELIHWSGPGNIDYHASPMVGLHVLARGEYTATKSGWERLNIPLEKKPEYDRYQPTHLAIVLASSIDGHLFIGAKGSKLTVDNLELIY